MSTSSHSRSRRSRFLAALLALLACLPFLTQCAHTTVSVPPPMLRLEDKNWTTRDGRQLPYLKWPGAPQKPEALLLCIHSTPPPGAELLLKVHRRAMKSVEELMKNAPPTASETQSEIVQSSRVMGPPQ